jgi:hypothetical protein
MVRSVLKKSKKTFFSMALVLLGLLHYSFKPAADEQQLLAWSNKCLAESYDPSAELNLKKWDIALTGDAFIRLRKTYKNGKQEYYSFQLHRFNSMNYLGTTAGGTLQLTAIADDIIVQTYNDPKGEIDTMATQINLPFKNMEPERLDSLQMVLSYFKQKDL